MKGAKIIQIIPAEGWHVRTWDPADPTFETVQPLIGWALVQERDPFGRCEPERRIVGVVADNDTYLVDDDDWTEYIPPALAAETTANVHERVARAEIERAA